MKFATKLVTPPAAAVVSTADAKTHLRVSTSSQDSYIDTLVTAATKHVEKLTNRLLITQTWELWADRFPGGSNPLGDWWDGVREEPVSLSSGSGSGRVLELPFSKLSSLTSLSTFNDSGTETTFSNSSYIVDTVSEPPRVVLARGSVWPSDLRMANAIKLVAIFGYGATAADVPADLVHAIKMLVAHWFENRESVISGTISKEIEQSLYALTEPYRVRNL